MKNELSIIMTTVNNKKQANDLIEEVIKKKLVACVQTREIESHYMWSGELCHDKEVLIWLKTEKRLFGRIKELLDEIHPYEVPEIISVPIENVSDEYGNWVHECVKY